MIDTQLPTHSKIQKAFLANEIQRLQIVPSNKLKTYILILLVDDKQWQVTNYNPLYDEFFYTIPCKSKSEAIRIYDAKISSYLAYADRQTKT